MRRGAHGRRVSPYSATVASRTWERVSFGAAANAAPPELDFCVPNLIAAGVGTVAADAGVGKTSLLLQLGAAVAAGIPLAAAALPAPRPSGRRTRWKG